MLLAPVDVPAADTTGTNGTHTLVGLVPIQPEVEDVPERFRHCHLQREPAVVLLGQPQGLRRVGNRLAVLVRLLERPQELLDGDLAAATLATAETGVVGHVPSTADHALVVAHVAHDPSALVSNEQGGGGGVGVHVVLNEISLVQELGHGQSTPKSVHAPTKVQPRVCLRLDHAITSL